MFTAKGQFASTNNFTISSFIDFASTMGANFKAWFNGYRDQVGESFEQSCAEFSSLRCEFKYLSFFFANWMDSVIYKAFLFKLFQEWIDEAGADLFSDAFPELANYAVAMGWSFV